MTAAELQLVLHGINVEPFAYQREVLTRLPQTPAGQHADLLPAAWVKLRPESTPPQP